MVKVKHSKSMCKSDTRYGGRTRAVKTAVGAMQKFSVKIGLQQGLAWSSFQFDIAINS